MSRIRSAPAALFLAAAFATTGLFATAGPAQASIKPCQIHHCTAVTQTGSTPQTPIKQCTPDNCDTLIEYYSDATFTVRVGEFEDGPCGQLDSGMHTSYYKTFRRIC